MAIKNQKIDYIIAMIRKLIKPYYKYIIRYLECQGSTQKKVLALIFWMFMPFLGMKTSPCWERHRQYGYKVLNSLPFKGRNLLSYVSVNMFIESFIEWLKKPASRKSENQIDIIADFSKTGNKYGKKMPLLYRLYDYVHNCHIKTHQICPLIICLGEQEFLIDFALWDPYNRKGNNQIVQEMIELFLSSLKSYKDGYLVNEFLKWARLTLDGGWGNGRMINWAKKIGFKFFIVKSGGKDLVEFKWNGRKYVRTLKGLERFLARNKHTRWQSFNKAYDLPGMYTYITVRLVSQNIDIKVLLLRFAHGYLMLLTSNVDLQANRIFKTYKRRWPIEVLFRTCKQKCGLERYHFHSEGHANIELFFSLRLLLCTMIHNYRVKHTKRSKTSLKDVIVRLEKEFDAMHPNTFQKLFTGTWKEENESFEFVKVNLIE